MASKNEPPDFVIVGAAKCGTTALHQYLARHPQVFMSDPKEPHYFATDLTSPHYITDRNTYLNLFRHAPSGSLCGEASVHYLRSLCAVDNILAHNARTKIIALLRNPVDMARSWHTQLLFNGEEDIESFEAAWRLQEKRARGENLPKIFVTKQFVGTRREQANLQYRTMCALGQQLQRLSHKVPATQLLVLTLDDLRTAPDNFYRTVTAFLALNALEVPSAHIVNASRRSRVPAIARFMNWSPFVNHPKIQAFKPFFDKASIHPLRLLRTINTAEHITPALDPAFRLELVAAFDSEITLIEQTLQRSFPHWRQWH